MKFRFVAVLLLIAFVGAGCAIDNRVVAKKTWDAKPPIDVAVTGEINANVPVAKDFKVFTDKWLASFLKGYKYTVADSADLKLTYTVDVLEPGNRWTRWLAGAFGAGQGYVQGTVSVRQGGVVVGSYDFAAVQRGGFFGGTLEDLAREAASGIAKKITTQKFDAALYDRTKK
jgi:hypothetical protein